MKLLAAIILTISIQGLIAHAVLMSSMWCSLSLSNEGDEKFFIKARSMGFKAEKILDMNRELVRWCLLRCGGWAILALLGAVGQVFLVCWVAR